MYNCIQKISPSILLMHKRNIKVLVQEAMQCARTVVMITSTVNLRCTTCSSRREDVAQHACGHIVSETIGPEVPEIVQSL
jgi:hypothetical protein